MQNSNSRLARTKRVLEVNYGKVDKGGQNPYIKGNSNRRFSLYNHVNKEGNYNNVTQHCENIAPQGKGQGGRGMGHGGHANASQGDGKNRVQITHNHPPKALSANRVKEPGIFVELCYHCGSTEHWFKKYKANNWVVVDYKKYKKAIRLL